jgi:hypothetical protein
VLLDRLSLSLLLSLPFLLFLYLLLCLLLPALLMLSLQCLMLLLRPLSRVPVCPFIPSRLRPACLFHFTSNATILLLEFLHLLFPSLHTVTSDSTRCTCTSSSIGFDLALSRISVASIVFSAASTAWCCA